MDVYTEAVELHRKLSGKLEVHSKYKVKNKDDLSLVYTPGVAEVCKRIAVDAEQAYELTIKNNTVAIVSDGSAVLGLGNIGPYAAIPVMEGKAMLFKEYADINAFPICLHTQNTDEIIHIIKNIAPVFGGINLEDIAALRCFEIEQRLQDIGIPVFHDDQHGTAIVLLAALINATRLAGKNLSELKVVINGAGAAGTAIAELLLCVGYDTMICQPVKELIVCDTTGIICKTRPDIQENKAKMHIANISNFGNVSGGLADALVGADVFIGVSVGNAVTVEMVKTMNSRAIVFAMANPTPEIMPDIAQAAGAFIVGTGRSDFPNQVNNVLAFPGIFRGAMDVRAKRITHNMKIAAAYALADCVREPKVDFVIPSPLSKTVAHIVAEAVGNAYKAELI